ncbi:hypothetical protein PR048_006943 [Dryococelus australis]|uniref:Uncharacterized protein n=1 Tax=Dryococelus australis TaxID=614101 RepID=A0ABQ9IEJ3_9NEOP|nr:hypothetical protein PR048_006943 [Dryococelus australis]
MKCARDSILPRPALLGRLHTGRGRAGLPWLPMGFTQAEVLCMQLDGHQQCFPGTALLRLRALRNAVGGWKVQVTAYLRTCMPSAIMVLTWMAVSRYSKQLGHCVSATLTALRYLRTPTAVVSDTSAARKPLQVLKKQELKLASGGWKHSEKIVPSSINALKMVMLCHRTTYFTMHSNISSGVVGTVLYSYSGPLGLVFCILTQPCCLTALRPPNRRGRGITSSQRKKAKINVTGGQIRSPNVARPHILAPSTTEVLRSSPSETKRHNQSRFLLTARSVIESGNLSRPPPAYGVNHYQHEFNPVIGHQREPHGGANRSMAITSVAGHRRAVSVAQSVKRLTGVAREVLGRLDWREAIRVTSPTLNRLCALAILQHHHALTTSLETFLITLTPSPKQNTQDNHHAETTYHDVCRAVCQCDVAYNNSTPHIHFPLSLELHTPDPNAHFTVNSVMWLGACKRRTMPDYLKDVPARRWMQMQLVEFPGCPLLYRIGGTRDHVPQDRYRSTAYGGIPSQRTSYELVRKVITILYTFSTWLSTTWLHSLDRASSRVSVVSLAHEACQEPMLQKMAQLRQCGITVIKLSGVASQQGGGSAHGRAKVTKAPVACSAERPTIVHPQNQTKDGGMHTGNRNYERFHLTWRIRNPAGTPLPPPNRPLEPTCCPDRAPPTRHEAESLTRVFPHQPGQDVMPPSHPVAAYKLPLYKSGYCQAQAVILVPSFVLSKSTAAGARTPRDLLSIEYAP